MPEEKLRKIRKYFSQKPSVAAVYLYGSQAKGEAKIDSDIDLGVILRGKKELAAFEVPQITFSQELSQILDKEVEVQDLEISRIDFQHRVLSEGSLIYSADEEKRIEFEEKILRDYFDLKPFFDEYYRCLSEIVRRGELHVRYFAD